MILTLLLASQVATLSPVGAERAFAADAKAIGQWTAFRKWALPEGSFLPPDRTVHEVLKDVSDPPVSVDWWPTESVRSCDGAVAANTGGARWPDGRASRFATLWFRQPDGGWKWRIDHGADVAEPPARPANGDVAVRQASCEGRPTRLVAPAEQAGRHGAGASGDGTLNWRWTVLPDGAASLRIFLWTGVRHEEVIAVEAPPPRGRPR